MVQLGLIRNAEKTLTRDMVKKKKCGPFFVEHKVLAQLGSEFRLKAVQKCERMDKMSSS